MDFELTYEGRPGRLPITHELVEDGDEFTVTREQVALLTAGGYLIGPRSPYKLKDPEHTREVVISRKPQALYDEHEELREYGEIFEASDEWLIRHHRLVASGCLVAAADFEGEVPEDEPEPADEEEVPAELGPAARIEQALESDNFNQMRSVLADLSDESTGGLNKAEIRDKLEDLLVEMEG
jgi:hypothetical protein